MKKDYWKNREILEREMLLDLTEEESKAQLQEMYKNAARDMAVKLAGLYAEIIQDAGGEVTKNHYYLYQRYYEILATIQSELQKLGDKETKLLDKQLTKLYKQNAAIVGSHYGISTSVNTKEVKDVVDGYWVYDGLEWSDRIWKHQRQLALALERGLSDVIITGKSHKELTKDIMKQFNASYKNAERLVRTELAHIQVQSTLDKYREAGLKQYMYLTARDERTCDICSELNEKVFDLESAQAGINLPPMHPNCRCTVLGVIPAKNNKTKIMPQSEVNK